MTVIVWEWFRNKRLLRLFIKHFASEFSLICLKFGPPSHKILKPQAFGKFGLDGIALGQESKIWLLIPPITYSLCDTGQVTTSLSPRFLIHRAKLKSTSRGANRMVLWSECLAWGESPQIICDSVPLFICPHPSRQSHPDSQHLLFPSFKSKVSRTQTLPEFFS